MIKILQTYFPYQLDHHHNRQEDRYEVGVNAVFSIEYKKPDDWFVITYGSPFARTRIVRARNFYYEEV